MKYAYLSFMLNMYYLSHMRSQLNISKLNNAKHVILVLSQRLPFSSATPRFVWHPNRIPVPWQKQLQRSVATPAQNKTHKNKLKSKRKRIRKTHSYAQ